ncbi:MAG TPA: hypothetical protein PLP42_21415 [Acidobacteriota bacterium]|nr:hypothetical protein [Acidobacteriota bacterium]
MRIRPLGLALLFAVWSSLVSIVAQERAPWPGSEPAGRLERRMDQQQVVGIIDNLNEECGKQHGAELIVKYYFDLGPLNRVQVNPQLWGRLTESQRREQGEKFAKAFKGSGLLFCQFFADDALVGKVRSDPIRGGLKFELVK